ncbi:MAG: class I SAM-dependent methyltransferase [Brevinematales bacterium]|nr:class I SAM-dependent methyltransferase [Brevinematales bacterium]
MEKLREHYLPFLAAKEEYAKLDWEDAFSHQKRFEVLVSSVPLEGKSLLDVGCGIGSLYRFLQHRGISCVYTGIDALPEMIRVAREYTPQGVFLVGNPFEKNMVSLQSFDVVYASGIFNLDLGQKKTFLYEAVGKMLSWARETVVFNALHCRSECQTPPYRYYNPREVVEYLQKTYPFKITLLEDYLPNDFTVVMEKTPRF